MYLQECLFFDYYYSDIYSDIYYSKYQSADIANDFYSDFSWSIENVYRIYSIFHTEDSVDVRAGFSFRRDFFETPNCERRSHVSPPHVRHARPAWFICACDYFARRNKRLRVYRVCWIYLNLSKRMCPFQLSYTIME